MKRGRTSRGLRIVASPPIVFTTTSAQQAHWTFRTGAADEGTHAARGTYGPAENDILMEPR